MSKVTIDNVTDVVIASLGQNGEITPRQREIMTAAIRHLHGFCKDVTPTHSEFIDACMFMGRAGAICDDKRQEFTLFGRHFGHRSVV
jgi:catechol 1,2-dioxygenase